MSKELDKKSEELATWFLEHQNDAKDADKCMQFIKRAMACQAEINIILSRSIADLERRTELHSNGLINRLKNEGR